MMILRLSLLLMVIICLANQQNNTRQLFLSFCTISLKTKGGKGKAQGLNGKAG